MRVEAGPGGGAHDPAQRGPLLAGAGGLAQEGQRHLAPEGPADHRQRGGAAIGEVDLAHQREAPRGDPRRGALGTVGQVDANRDAGVFRGRRERRRALPDAGADVAVAEVEGADGDPAQMEPGAILETGREGRLVLAQLGEHGAVELEQGAVADRGHARQAGGAAKRADLPEHVAGPQEANVTPAWSVTGPLDEAPGLDDPPVIGLLALGDDDLAVARVGVTAAGDEQTEPGSVQPRERRVHPQEGADPLGACLRGETGGGLGVRTGEGAGNRPVEAQDAHGGRRCAQGHRRRVVLGERALTARLSRAEQSERDLGPVGPLGDRARLALDDDDERLVGGGEHGLPETVGVLLEPGEHEVGIPPILRSPEHLRRKRRWKDGLECRNRSRRIRRSSGVRRSSWFVRGVRSRTSPSRWGCLDSRCAAGCARVSSIVRSAMTD